MSKAPVHCEVICPYCNQPAVWVPNSEIYGKCYGKSWMCYLCKPCNAYVGCKNNTREPLGTLANKELRQLRLRAHSMIDWIWKERRLRRNLVYARLSHFFNKDVHIGQAREEECLRIIDAAPVIFSDLL